MSSSCSGDEMPISTSPFPHHPTFVMSLVNPLGSLIAPYSMLSDNRSRFF